MKSAESERRLLNEPIKMRTSDFTEYEGGELCLEQDKASPAQVKSEKSHRECPRANTRNLE